MRTQGIERVSLLVKKVKEIQSYPKVTQALSTREKRLLLVTENPKTSKKIYRIKNNDSKSHHNTAIITTILTKTTTTTTTTTM